MPGKIYLTGATGRLGAVVLPKTGAVPLVRKASGLKDEIVTDFSNDQLRSILGDARAVIHLAGSIHEPVRKLMHESNVGLTWRIVNAIPDSCRIIFSSSISVYGKKPAKKPADEDTKTNPDSDYAKTKLEAEDVVRKHAEHVILRIGPLYGPQFPDYFLILDRLKRGKMRILGDGSNRIPFVHADDVAAVIAASLEKGRGTYVVAGDPLTQRQVYESASREMGIPFRMGSVNPEVAMLFAGISERIDRKSAIKREHISILSNDRVFDCTKARKELGFSPRPLEQGIKEMVAAYRTIKR